MSLSPEVIDAMVAAGCTAEQLGAAMKADVAASAAKVAEKRAKAAERKARWRASRNVPQCPEDSEGRDGTDGDTPSPKERSPTPPKEITPTRSSLRSVSVSASARAIFESEFWPRYPHKVGKPAAERAFEKLWREMAGIVAPVLCGLERYLRDKPADRPWLNPATFLNQRRFEDQPGVPPARAGPGIPPRGRSVAELARMNLDDEPDIFDDDHHGSEPRPRNGAAAGSQPTDEARSGFAGRLSEPAAHSARRGALIDH